MIISKHNIKRAFAGFLIATVLAVSSTTGAFAKPKSPPKPPGACFYNGHWYKEGSIIYAKTPGTRWKGLWFYCKGGVWWGFEAMPAVKELSITAR